jgi:hypothetical protein
MKLFLTFLCTITFATTFSQNDFTDADAKQVIDIFFEGFHEGDTLKMRSVLSNNVALQTAFSGKDGKSILNDGSIDDLLNAIANRKADQKWDERLLDYKINVDGNLAHVWTPYQFWFNDAFSHCGANSFTLVKTDAGWKIVHLIDSRKKEGCLD